MFNGRLDEALACTRRIHSMEHKNQADAHIVAARALERKHLLNEA